jgi:DNA-binding response OmpR family regulator
MNEIVFPGQTRRRDQPAPIASRESDPPGERTAGWNFRFAPGMKVLIADGDGPLCSFLSSELEERGFVVTVAVEGEQAYATLQEKVRYNLLIVDLNLPGMDGFTLIERVRALQPRLPIMVLTARNRLEDRVASFQIGADDYVTKPFSIVELQARIFALTRRNSGTIPRFSRVGDLTLDRDGRRVERGSRRVDLTPREFAILEVITRTPGCPVSRSTLLDEVWNVSGEPSTNIVDVYMKYVRDKVDAPGEERLIHTIRGFGYEIRGASVAEVERAKPVRAEQSQLQFVEYTA